MAERKAIHATLGLGPNTSEFRGKPSPEVDAAWDRVTQTYLYPMTKQDVLKMGNDPEYAVLMPEAMGFGEGHYAGFMDVEHKIHCLDVLRKDIYSDYYGKNDSPLWTNHVDHCIYILLEGLMCHPNLQVIPYVWMEGHPAPVPDFIQNERCWDFDTLVAWRRSHGHLNDRNYYGLYQNLRHKSKETPITPDMQELREEEAVWKLGSPHQSEHEHL